MPTWYRARVFDRVKEIGKRWDALPVGPWKVYEVAGRFVLRDAHGRILAECADRALADAIARSYEDVAHLTGEVSRLRRALKTQDEQSGDFVGKAHDGRVTLATYRVESDGDGD